MKDLIKTVDKGLAEYTMGNMTMMFDVQTEKVTVHLKNGYQLVIAGKMSIILGFGGKQLNCQNNCESLCGRLIWCNDFYQCLV